MANPLVEPGVPPAYDRIEPGHVEPGMRGILGELATLFTQIEERAEPTWEAAVAPLETVTDRLQTTWGVVTHLLGVRNCDALRRAHEAVQPEIVAFSLRLGQSRRLYDAWGALARGHAWKGLDPAQRRIVTLLRRDAELAGVGLEGAARARFNTIQSELARLGTCFSNNVLDATRAFALDLRDQTEIEGLPATARALAAHSAREAGHAAATAEEGPWRITLEQPSYVPFMQHASRRDLRESLYRAYVTRAAGGAQDNGPLIIEILRLRRELATLVGFATYAEASLATKMASHVSAVTHLLDELREAAWAPAHHDLDDLRTLARADGAPEADALAPWDVPYWAERLREARYAYTDEELRPFFPLPRVLDGLFALTERLFGVRVRPADGEVAVWHPDVRFFRIVDAASDRPLAGFYLDAYSRPAEKRGGAWMDECVGRTPTRLPIAHLVCNQTPPVDGRPSCMSFDEVHTLFHEFGHGLQHMLTTVDHPLAAGIRNVEWDAVELASQFMENWCYHHETLGGLSRHVDTGAPLPAPLFEKLRAARTFRSGSDMLRQLYFAYLDLDLHHDFDPDGAATVVDVQRAVAARTTVLPPIPEDRFLCGFSHIFAGGYAAGYYSYKWAEVLAADAFGAFEEAGLHDAGVMARTGRRFRDTVLALGGSRHPAEVFRAFRGRDPSTAALLRQAGLR